MCKGDEEKAERIAFELANVKKYLSAENQRSASLRLSEANMDTSLTTKKPER